MTEKKDAAESMRRSAARMCAIANEVETKLSAELLRIAQNLEKEADEIEARTRKRPAAGDGATGP